MREPEEYGITDKRAAELTDMFENFSYEEKDYLFALTSRYVFESDIFDVIHKSKSSYKDFMIALTCEDYDMIYDIFMKKLNQYTLKHYQQEKLLEETLIDYIKKEKTI